MTRDMSSPDILKKLRKRLFLASNTSSRFPQGSPTDYSQGEKNYFKLRIACI